MKRTPSRQKKIVNLIHDADPTFVSLVKHGANQRPFHTTKSAQKEGDMSRATNKKKGAAKKAPATKINRIQFSAADFANFEAVEAFLSEKGYSDFEVTKLDDGNFEVIDTPADQFVGDLREVPHTSVKGVTYFVGTAKDADPKEGDEDEDGDEDENEDAGDDKDDTAKGDDPKDPAQPAPGDTQPDADPAKTDTPPEADPKADQKPKDDTAKGVDTPAPRKRERKGALIVNGSSMNAFVGDCERFGDFLETKGVTAKSFGDSVSEYTGGTPPGMYVLTDALNSELRKMLRAGRADETKVAALAADFGRGVMGLMAAYESIINASVTKTAKTADPDEDAAVEALFALMFGAPGAAADDTANALKAMEATLAAGLATMQATLDGMAVAAHEATLKGVDDEPAPRKVAGRKSAVEAEEQEEAEGDDRTPEEKAADDRRAMKRLGMGGY